MARLSPEEAAQKWAQRTGAAVQDYQRGVQRVQTAPGQLAARQVQKWLYNTQNSAEKFVRNVSRQSLGEWQQAAVEKGGQRLAGGVQAAQPKMAARMAELLPHIDRGLAQLASMPSVSEADSENRALFWMRHMRAFGQRGGQRR